MINQAKILCALAVSGFAAFVLTSPAQALTAQECSAKYQAAKTAGTLGDQKWNDFRKAQCGADATAALASLARIDDAIQNISTNRAKYGATLNRLDITISSIQTMRLNISAANSRIRDVDVATETANLSRNQVLGQAGVAVLAQANQLPTLALKLLQG